MDNDNKTGKRAVRREIPQLPPRGTRALPPMPSTETGDEIPAPRIKKRRSKKESRDVDDTEDAGMEMEAVASHRQTESRKCATPEPQEVPQQKKRRKKRAQSSDVDADRSGLVNGDGVEHPTDGEEVTKKSKRKKKPKATEVMLPSELDVEDDDIISDIQAPVTQSTLFSAPVGHSQPVGKVFVEKTRRFQATDRLDLGKNGTEVAEYMEVRPLWSTRDVALRVHTGFRMIGLFSHGFLAGYAVWNITVVYMLAGEQLSSLSNLLQQYHSLAYPSQSLLYLLLSISIVSAFDRMNLAKASVALRGFLTLDPAATASILYFAALILSLSQQMVSDRINLYPMANETLWPSGSEQEILQPWIVVNLVVAVLVGLAWIFVAMRHDVDFTEDCLMAMYVDEHPRQQEKQEDLA